MEHVIVTGGAGFIGSHLVDRLLRDGCRVTAIDNLSTGRRKNVQHLTSNENFTLLEMDVNDLDPASPHLNGVACVYHLAALADIVPSIQKPMQYYRANVSGTVSVLEACRRAGVKRVVYAASSSCYGIPTEVPTSEEARVNPQYPYALTKYLAEEILFHWAQVYKIPCVSLRLFNVYGPRARTSGTYGAVFGVFLAQKLAGKPFTVVGDGTQSRDFTYVTDVVDAFVTAAKSPIQNEVFNVGSDGTYTVNQLIDLLGGNKVFVPKRPGEPDCTHANISKIRKTLEWKPKVSFDEGVRRMLECINDWREAPVWNQNSIAEATKDWFQYLQEPQVATTANQS
jgi:UDP-glucose 4-epimerase